MILSDPSYTLRHQLRFQNVKAENVVFGQFRTLIEILTEVLAFIKILQKNSDTARHRLHTLAKQIQLQNIKVKNSIYLIL